jgi:hypothetical protein
MTINLTKEEKTQIISSHIKSLNYTKYNLELDIIQENARVTPSLSAINNSNSQMDEVNNQILALEAELTTVNSTTEEA